MNEKVTITLGDDVNSERLEEILSDNNFYVKANQGIEKTFALGTGAFLLSLKDVTAIDTGRVKIQFINAENIYPLTFDENGITECAFTSYGTRVDTTSGSVDKILDLQVHLQNEQGNYTINNYKFIVGENDDLKQIKVDDREDKNIIRDVIETNMPNPWFVIIQPNIINNIDLYSPFGIAIFANALDTLKALDQSYDSLVNEIQNGRKRLFVTADAMKVSTSGCYKNAFDPNDVLFYILDKKFEDKSQYVQEVNGQLRIDEISKAIQTNLNLLSMKLGMGDNYYRFDGNAVSKTATEVISENSDLFRTLQKHKILLESAIKKLIDTIGVIVDLNTENIQIDFDDSIIESKEQERLQDRQDLAIETMSRKEYRMKWYGEDEETALAKLTEIDAEKEAGAQINFMDEEID